MLMELVLQSTFAGQQCINRFNYVATGTPAAVSRSFALISAFGCIYDEIAVPPGYPAATPFGVIRQMQHTQVTYDFASAKAVYNLEDFYETPFIQAANGTDNGADSMSPLVAYGFRTGRVRGDIGRGYKRFVGVNEGRVGAQGAIASTFLNGAMAIVATRMGEVLTYNDEGNTLTFSPCIVKKEKYVPNPANPDRVAYRYFPTEAEQLENVALGIAWDAYSTVRSQVSRQYGRGR